MTLTSLEGWFALVIGLSIMVGSPGPAVLAVVGYSLEFGKSLAAGLFVAFVLGQCTAFVLAVAGFGMILANSPGNIVFLRLAGGCLLLLVGVSALIRNRKTKPHRRYQNQERSRQFALVSTWIVTATSPIAIIFYIAVLPEYLNYSAINPTALFYLTATVTGISMATGLFYIVTTCVSRKVLVSNAKSRWISCLGNFVLILTGIWAISATLFISN